MDAPTYEVAIHGRTDNGNHLVEQIRFSEAFYFDGLAISDMLTILIVYYQSSCNSSNSKISVSVWASITTFSRVDSIKYD